MNNNKSRNENCANENCATENSPVESKFFESCCSLKNLHHNAAVMQFTFAQQQQRGPLEFIMLTQETNGNKHVLVFYIVCLILVYYFRILINSALNYVFTVTSDLCVEGFSTEFQFFSGKIEVNRVYQISLLREISDINMKVSEEFALCNFFLFKPQTSPSTIIY